MFILAHLTGEEAPAISGLMIMSSFAFFLFGYTLGYYKRYMEGVQEGRRDDNK